MLLVYRIVLLQIGLRFNATCKNTSFQKLVSVQNCSLFFSSLLSLQSLCLHSNAKTPSSVILSQHIATFFFGRLSSIVSTPHTSALIQSLSAEMGKYNFLQKKGLTVMILEWQDFLSERNSVVLQCIRFYRWSRVI